MIKKLLFLIFTGTLLAGPCLAQMTLQDTLYRDSIYRRVIIAGSDSLNCYLAYPLGGYQVVKDFGDNLVELEKIDRFVRSALSDTLVYVRQVRMTGHSSIDGAYAVNERLAKNRVDAFRGYMDEQYQLSSRYDISVGAVGEDWPALRALLAASELPYKEAVLRIIDSPEAPDSRERSLASLAGGVPYRDMLRNLFPQLRRVEILVEYDLRKLIEERYRRKLTDHEYTEALVKEQAAAKAEEARLKEVAQQKIREKVEAEAREKARIEEEKKKEDYIRKEKLRKEQEVAQARRREREAEREARRIKLLKFNPVLSVKTNLVPWTGLTPEFDRTTFMPNVAVEGFFAERWSVSASATYSDFDFDGGQQHWGVSGYSLEPRFWLDSSGAYRGLYFGVFGQMGDFGTRLEDKEKPEGVTANHTGTYLQAGVSAGYYLQVSKHFGFELGLRAGYHSADAQEYNIRGEAAYLRGPVDADRVGLMEINVSACYRF